MFGGGPPRRGHPEGHRYKGHTRGSPPGLVLGGQSGVAARYPPRCFGPPVFGDTYHAIPKLEMTGGEVKKMGGLIYFFCLGASMYNIGRQVLWGRVAISCLVALATECVFTA